MGRIRAGSASVMGRASGSDSAAATIRASSSSLRSGSRRNFSSISCRLRSRCLTSSAENILSYFLFIIPPFLPVRETQTDGVDVAASIGVDAEAKLIANEPGRAESLLASHITILLDGGVFEIELRNVGKIHSVLDEIGSAVRPVPADH